MNKLPYMQFYPADYLLDTADLSLRAQGAWMRLLCHMWRSDPRGSVSWTDAQYCRILRCPGSVWRELLAELSCYKTCDVSTSVTGGHEVVTLTNRRMQNEEKLRISNRLRKRKQRSSGLVTPQSRGSPPESHISESEFRNEFISENKFLSSSFVVNGSPDEPAKRDLRAEAREILDFLNSKTGRQFRAVDATLALIMARLRGQSAATAIDVQTCKSMIARKVRDWGSDEKMRMYLRPETLFNRTKFESYLGELGELCAAPNVTDPLTNP